MKPTTEEAEKLTQHAGRLAERAMNRLSEVSHCYGNAIVVPERNDPDGRLIRVLPVPPREVRAALIEARGLLSAALELIPEDYEPTEHSPHG